MEHIEKFNEIFTSFFQNDCRCKVQKIDFSRKIRSSFHEGHGSTDQFFLNRFNEVLNSVNHLIQFVRNNYDSNFDIYIEKIFHESISLLEHVMCEKNDSTFPFHKLMTVISNVLDIMLFDSNEERNLETVTFLYKNNISQLVNIESNLVSSSELSARLRVVSLLYNSVLNVRSRIKEKCSYTKSFIRYVNDSSDFECRYFSKLLISSNCCDAASAEVLLNIVPKHIEIIQSNKILMYMWNEISKCLDHGQYNQCSRMLIVLCYISCYYFTDPNFELISKILKDKYFWFLIHKGLSNPDCSVRKQALFVLKSSLEFLWKRTLNFSTDVSLKKPILSWEPCSRLEVHNGMKEFCTILEYLEEKQVHLVEPIFVMIESFLFKYAVNEQILDTSWILLVFERMLCHDNMKIVRWGLCQLLKIPMKLYHDTELMIKAVQLLVGALNCTQIYFNDASLISTALKDFFRDIDKNASRDEVRSYFQILIKQICSVRWSSEALFFMSSSLSNAPVVDSWEKDEIELLKDLVQNGTANHYTYIRSGMLCHLLISSTSLINTKSVSLIQIAGFLNCFKRTLCLKKGSKVWNCVTHWIKESYSMTDVEYFLKSCMRETQLDPESMGKMIAILYDAYASNEVICSLIRKVICAWGASFSNVYARPYCNVEMQEYNLSVIYYAIEENPQGFWSIIDEFARDFASFIAIQLNSINNIKDLELCDHLLKVLQMVIDSKSAELQSFLMELLKSTVQRMDEDEAQRNFVKQCVRVKLVVQLMDAVDCYTCVKYIQSYLRNHLNSAFEKQSDDSALMNEFQTMWGKMNSDYLCCNWWLLAKLCKYCKTPTKVLSMKSGEFVITCFYALDIAGCTVLLPFLDVLDEALPELRDDPRFSELLQNLWSLIRERKKNDEYYLLIKKFVKILISEDLIKSIECQGIVMEFSEKILFETTTNAVTIFMKQLQSLTLEDDTLYFFREVLPHVLLYGQPLRKDERLISEISAIVGDTNFSPLENDASTSAEVRARALQILLKMDAQKKSHSDLAADLIKSLIELEAKINKNRTRYFSDSHVHRVKQRMMQSLLILYEYTAMEASEGIWSWLCSSLITENNQSSVRYLQEWLMLRILLKNPNSRKELWTLFDEGLERRTGSLCSLIAVVYQSIKIIPSKDLEEWMDRALSTFLPYCMAQHFSVRLYAQVTLQKILDQAEKLALTSIQKKYHLIKRTLLQSIERGNAVKNSVKMQEDFYFTVFHPIEHYSIDAIFNDLPRLTSVTPEEWITLELLLKCGAIPISSQIPIKSANYSLKRFEERKWLVEGTKRDNCTDQTEKLNESSNFQKKMIPFKSLVPNWEAMLDSNAYNSRKDEKDGLVVVASLIDRIPNLGGLTRTCEIFGASELVISSLKYTEDKQFQSLSVTAEKWISIIEVKPFHLAEYLSQMKENGYTIVAAEQTMNSQSLNSVRFPKKSLLLLGNEKEGIPPSLLPLTDLCIEIPQMGVIRSLNVHVTGALFVWEYAKQHQFNV